MTLKFIKLGLPVDTLFSFKRVKAITTDKNEILNILINQGSDFIEFSEDYRYLKRKSPFNPAGAPQKKPLNCSLEVVSILKIINFKVYLNRIKLYI